jgi:hypothetical protein
MSKLQVLTELERRGLITSDPVLPVSTEAGIAEAKWFAEGPKADGAGYQS